MSTLVQYWMQQVPLSTLLTTAWRSFHRALMVCNIKTYPLKAGWPLFASLHPGPSHLYINWSMALFHLCWLTWAKANTAYCDWSRGPKLFRLAPFLAKKKKMFQLKNKQLVRKMDPLYIFGSSQGANNGSFFIEFKIDGHHETNELVHKWMRISHGPGSFWAVLVDWHVLPLFCLFLRKRVFIWKSLHSKPLQR